MPLVIVRHAKAGSRSAWAQDDDLRPLTKAGARQAEAVADRLADEPFKRVLSSRFVRCVQTVAPLAQRLGLEVEDHPALAEEADLDDTEALLEELAGTDAVLCTHGNVLGALLKRLRRRGVELVGPDGGGGGGKGSAWRLEPNRKGRWTRATYQPPG
jgi:broad specificity phosphatase PhoE